MLSPGVSTPTWTGKSSTVVAATSVPTVTDASVAWLMVPLGMLRRATSMPLIVAMAPSSHIMPKMPTSSLPAGSGIVIVRRK
jgi:hypothetical protein